MLYYFAIWICYNILSCFKNASCWSRSLKGYSYHLVSTFQQIRRCSLARVHETLTLGHGRVQVGIGHQILQWQWWHIPLFGTWVCLKVPMEIAVRISCIMVIVLDKPAQTTTEFQLIRPDKCRNWSCGGHSFGRRPKGHQSKPATNKHSMLSTVWMELAAWQDTGTPMGAVGHRSRSVGPLVPSLNISSVTWATRNKRFEPLLIRYAQHISTWCFVGMRQLRPQAQVLPTHTATPRKARHIARRQSRYLQPPKLQ